MSALLATLAPLGAIYKLSIVPEYAADGTVSVAIVYSLKSDKDGSSIKTLNLQGTIEEVDAALVAELPAAVGKLVAHTTTLKDLDAQLAAEVEAKKSKGKGAKKPEPKEKEDEEEEEKKDDNAVPDPKPEPVKRGKNRETKIIKTTPATPETPPATIETHAVPTPVNTALVPAWKGATPVAEVTPAPAPTTDESPPDLGSLF